MMTHSIIAQTEAYELKTCRASNQNILVRLTDFKITYLDDLSVNMLMELTDNDNDFDKVAATYRFIDPVYEK